MGLVYYAIRGLDSDRFVLLYDCQHPRQERYMYIYDGHLSHLYQAVCDNCAHSYAQLR